MENSYLPMLQNVRSKGRYHFQNRSFPKRINRRDDLKFQTWENGSNLHHLNNKRYDLHPRPRLDHRKLIRFRYKKLETFPQHKQPLIRNPFHLHKQNGLSDSKSNWTHIFPSWIARLWTLRKDVGKTEQRRRQAQ